MLLHRSVVSSHTLLTPLLVVNEGPDIVQCRTLCQIIPYVRRPHTMLSSAVVFSSSEQIAQASHYLVVCKHCL